MNKVEVVFTGNLGSGQNDKIHKLNDKLRFLQFNLLKFSSNIDEDNIKSLSEKIDLSTIVCLSSKTAVNCLKKYPDLLKLLSDKVLVVSGELLSQYLKEELGLSASFSDSLQGQKGIVNQLSKIIEPEDHVIYLHSNKADGLIEDFFQNERINGQHFVIYNTEYNEKEGLNLSSHLKKSPLSQYKTLIFFASPSAVEAYKIYILKPDTAKNLAYLSFGQSTKLACDNFLIESYFKKNSKDYIDTIAAYCTENKIFNH